MTEHDRRYRGIAEYARIAKEAGVSTEYLMYCVLEGIEDHMPRLRRIADSVIADQPKPAIDDDWIQTGRRP